jgi:hypothetical protein
MFSENDDGNNSSIDLHDSDSRENGLRDGVFSDERIDERGCDGGMSNHGERGERAWSSALR